LVSIRKYRKKRTRLGMIDILRRRTSKEGYLVLLYDSKYLQHPGKFIGCIG
jgi:hypothetical protein